MEHSYGGGGSIFLGPFFSSFFLSFSLSPWVSFLPEGVVLIHKIIRISPPEIIFGLTPLPPTLCYITKWGFSKVVLGFRTLCKLQGVTHASICASRNYITPHIFDPLEFELILRVVFKASFFQYRKIPCVKCVKNNLKKETLRKHRTAFKMSIRGHCK
jgi:hypothetical protein